MFSSIKKWFLLCATGSFLLQATGGCDSTLQTTLMGGVESLVTGLISLYVETAVGSLIGV